MKEAIQVIIDLLTLLSGTDFYATLEALATNGRIFGTVICAVIGIIFWVKTKGTSPPERTTLNADVNQCQAFDWPKMNMKACLDIHLGTKKESHPEAKGNDSHLN